MHAKRLLLAAGCTAAMLAVPAVVEAQTVPAAPAAAQKTSANGVKAYEAGAKAYEAGKYAPAIQSLSSALSTGGLSSQQMAKALYYRGAAYRKTGKSAQAISDLTSAVWLKNGLSDADRAAATEQRQGAYKEAGLGTGAAVGAPPLDAPVAAPVATPAAAPVAVDAATSSWAATSAKGAAEASVPNLPTAASDSGFVSAPSAPSLSAMPQGEGSAETSASAPLGGVGTAMSNAGSAVTGFFGNMFGGGGNSATGAPSADVATAAAAPEAAARPSPAVPAAADWGAATSVQSGTTPTAPKAVKKPKTAAVDPSRAAASGKYRLQVGIVRSREEAEQITARLRSEHSAAIGAAAPAIDEVAFGNNTFYRVQVGPYASAAEPGQFCSALKPKGFDCLVVSK